jgi:hypothetical protein
VLILDLIVSVLTYAFVALEVQKLWLVDLLMSIKIDNQTNGLRAFFEKPQDVESQPKQI